MRPRKQAYFSISGDAILSLIRERSNIPPDTELVCVIPDSAKEKGFFDMDNTVRLLVTSKQFDDLLEGQTVPLLSVVFDKTKKEKHDEDPSQNPGYGCV